MTNLELQDIKAVAEQKINWIKLRNKIVLISGGTGFLGQFLINVLKYRNKFYDDNIKVISLSRRTRENDGDVVYMQADITQAIDLDKHIDYVIHLASNTHPMQYATDPIGTITTNVLGCDNLLKLATRCNAERFLLASSVEIYGEGNGQEIDESYCGLIDCNTVRAGYNEAKRVSESLCQAYIAQKSLDCVIVRFARCFGADRKNDSKAMAQFISKAVNGEDIVLKSKGEQRFSYCYVADAVGGMLKVLTDGKIGEAYNVSEDDEGKTLGEYAQFIASYVNKKVIFDCAQQEGASKTNYAIINCGKLKALGWKPLFSVSEALKKTIDIYKNLL